MGIKEAELQEERQDENRHIVESRWNTGEITEAWTTWREGLNTIINLSWMSLEQHVSIRKQGNRTADGCLVRREGESRWH